LPDGALVRRLHRQALDLLSTSHLTNFRSFPRP
jgi:hypothetical protein